MATVAVTDATKPDYSNVVVPTAPRRLTLGDIASEIDLLDILITVGIGYAIKSGKLLNWIRKPWDLWQDLVESRYTGPEDELRSVRRWIKYALRSNRDERFLDFDDEDGRDYVLQRMLKKQSRWSLGLHKYSGTPDLMGFRGVGQAYIAGTHAGLRQGYFN